MQSHTWEKLTHIDLSFGVRILINVKGRHGNIAIGRPMNDGVERYFNPPTNEELTDLVTGIMEARTIIEKYRAQIDAEKEARDAMRQQRQESNKRPAPREVVGLRELARRDAIRKGVSPEVVIAKQHERKTGPDPSRSARDAKLRSEMKGKKG